LFTAAVVAGALALGCLATSAKAQSVVIQGTVPLGGYPRATYVPAPSTVYVAPAPYYYHHHHHYYWHEYRPATVYVARYYYEPAPVYPSLGLTLRIR
jgi:hypothetical protein